MKVWIIKSYFWLNGDRDNHEETLAIFKAQENFRPLMEAAFSKLFDEFIAKIHHTTQDKCEIERFDASILKYIKVHGAGEGVLVQAYRHEVLESKDLTQAKTRSLIKNIAKGGLI